jgi:hypothetical protein
MSVLLWSVVPSLAADETTPEGERLAHAAVDLCLRADALDEPARRAMLARGLALAERAVAADARRARAHFAVFCTLGKLVEADGIGWRTLGAVRRVRLAAEQAVALDPLDVDALVGKGVLLLRLPRLLGGDADEARRCLERALMLDPWHATARTYLDTPAAATAAAASLSAMQPAE